MLYNNINIQKFNINNIVKYTNLILENLKKTGLKKVLIKVDPIFANKLDFSKATSYEGYVLHENNGSLKILVIPDSITLDDIPEDVIEYIANDGENDGDVWEDFKSFVKRIVSEVKGPNDPLVTQIDNSCNLEDIKTFLKQNGFDEEDLNIIFADFIFSDKGCPVMEARFRDYATIASKKTGKAIVSPKTYTNVAKGVASGIETAYNAPGQFARGLKDVVVGGDISPITGSIRGAANKIDTAASKAASSARSLKAAADKRQQDQIQKSLYQPVKFPSNGTTINIDLGEVDAPDFKIQTQAIAKNRQNYQNGFVYDLQLKSSSKYVDALKIVVSQGSGQAQTFYYKNGMPVNSPQGLGLSNSNYFAYDPTKRRWVLSAQQPSAPEMFSVSRITQLNPGLTLKRGSTIQLQLGKFGKKNAYLVVSDPNLQDDTVILKKVS